MNKRHLHHLWTYVRRIKVWQLFVLLLASIVVSVFALRANNLQMARLRTAVYQADQNNGAVVQTLQNLRAYVQAHMNTNLTEGNTAVYPPIQLKYTYQRLQQAERQRVASANTVLYNAAQTYCQQQDPTDFSGHNRVPCVESYVAQHGATAKTIPAGLYKFSFISPTWSPDLAGWMIVLSAVLLLATAMRFVVGWWAKRHLS